MTDLNTSAEAKITDETAIGFIPCYRLPFISFYNSDNMAIMKTFKDKEFDLAIVDPPYGIGADLKNSKRELKSKKSAAISSDFGGQIWDSAIPTEEYFAELKRISKKQIIWGANHFELPQSRGWIFWDKLMDKGFSLADGELAWTSFDKAVKKFTYLWAGFKKAKPENRIHPTQKPVDLYRFCLQNYANKGMKILDTHGGSMNSAIACEIEGFDLDICEIDSEYFEAGVNAFNLHKRQQRLF